MLSALTFLGKQIPLGFALSLLLFGVSSVAWGDRANLHIKNKTSQPIGFDLYVDVQQNRVKSPKEPTLGISPVNGCTSRRMSGSDYFWHIECRNVPASTTRTISVGNFSPSSRDGSTAKSYVSFYNDRSKSLSARIQKTAYKKSSHSTQCNKKARMVVAKGNNVYPMRQHIHKTGKGKTHCSYEVR